ncbi:MAG TPA: MFS transporter [Opitutaceae bacterium]
MKAMSDPKTVNQALQRSTRRLLPFLVLLYILAFIDRVNIGFAKRDFQADTGMSEAAFAFGASIFFIGYALFEVPSNLVMHRVGARRWIGRIMVTWGTVAALMAFAWTEKSFYVLRFLLGVAEAGFFPGVILYLTYWFPASRMGPAVGVFYFGAPLAQVVGGPLSGALMDLHGLGALTGWQWMFLVEGVAAVVAGLLVYRFLPDRPEDARWLSPEQKSMLIAAVHQEHVTAAAVDKTWRAILNPEVIRLGAVYGMIQVGVYGVAFYWPAKVALFLGLNAGFVVGLWSAIPWMFALGAAYLAPRLVGRRATAPGIVAGFLGAAACGVAFTSSEHAWLAVLSTTLALAGLIGAQPVFWTIPARMMSPAAAAGGLALINSMGAMGGFIAPNLKVGAESTFQSAEAGALALAACALGAGLLTFKLWGGTTTYPPPAALR